MMYIHKVEILEEYREKEIGKHLIGMVKEICQSNKMSKVFVITNKSNIGAVRLYESTGDMGLDDDSIVYWYNFFNHIIIAFNLHWRLKYGFKE